MARATPRRSPLINVTGAAAMATSVPVPIAMPTSACARAGASLMPSPTMATIFEIRESEFGRLQLLDLGGFSLRQNFRQNHIDTHLFGDRFGGLAVIAGDHGHLQAHAVQFLDRCLRAILDRIGHSDHACDRAVHRDQHGSLGFGLQTGDLGFEPFRE